MKHHENQTSGAQRRPNGLCGRFPRARSTPHVRSTPYILQSFLGGKRWCGFCGTSVNKANVGTGNLRISPSVLSRTMRLSRIMRGSPKSPTPGSTLVFRTVPETRFPPPLFFSCYFLLTLISSVSHIQATLTSRHTSNYALHVRSSYVCDLVECLRQRDSLR